MKYLELGNNEKTEFQMKLHRNKNHAKATISKGELIFKDRLLSLTPLPVMSQDKQHTPQLSSCYFETIIK